TFSSDYQLDYWDLPTIWMTNSINLVTRQWCQEHGYLQTCDLKKIPEFHTDHSYLSAIGRESTSMWNPICALTVNRLEILSSDSIIIMGNDTRVLSCLLLH